MTLEYLDSKEGGVRTVSPWMRNLEKLGIALNFATVDFALYQQRLDRFDFDITTINFPGTNNPGQQYADLFGSKAAETEARATTWAVKSPRSMPARGTCRRRHQGRTAARLPRAGPRDHAQPLPDSPVDADLAPHRLQRLAAGASRRCRRIRRRGLGHGHLVGQAACPAP
jgi:hypothetical protein